MNLTIERKPARERGPALVLLMTTLVVTGLLITSGPAHAATFTVNTTNDLGDVDLGDGVCDVNNIPGIEACTLRAAIQEANATRGADVIAFGIGGGSGVKTISPTEELPNITGAVTIDGYTQPGASENTQTQGTDAVLQIQLDGNNAGADATGLTVRAPNSMVRGLTINGFSSAGVEVFGDSKVEGNFIGTDPSGTLRRTNVTGVDDNGGKGDTIGGTTPEARNIISGNVFGIQVVGEGGNKIQGNLIGTENNGTGNLGNSFDGVEIVNSPNNTIGGLGAANIIAFNGGGSGTAGVSILGDGSTGNRVLDNSIFSNEILDIDLRGDGPTANDLKDPDAGSNALQNFPVLTSATSNGTTIIEGTLNSTPSIKRKKKRPIRRTFTIQFFADLSGGDGGELFLGRKTVTTNRQGNAPFTFSSLRVPPGVAVTATATRNSTGDTSEFSEPRIVTAA